MVAISLKLSLRNLEQTRLHRQCQSVPELLNSADTGYLSARIYSLVTIPMAITLLLFGLIFAGFCFKKLAETSRFQLFGQMINGITTEEKVLALTYDDGPNPPHTNRLMEVLEKYGAKATFFVIGSHAEQHVETVRQLIGQGHELANHSYSHRRLVWTPKAIIAEEIHLTDQLLQRLGSKHQIHFRAPYGYKRIRLPLVLAQLKKINVLWNIDPRDYQANRAEAIVERVLQQVQPGSIVLLHDGGGDRSLTVEATAQLIPQLQQQGYQLKTVSELLALQANHS